MLIPDSQPRTRARLTAAVYWTLLACLAPAAVYAGLERPLRPLAVCVAVGVMGVISYLDAEFLHDRRPAVFDATIALVLLGLAFGGPVAAALVAGLPDLLRLIRRGRGFWGLGLLANAVSFLAEALAGAAVLAVEPSRGPGFVVALLVAGTAMAAVNYLFARLLLAWLRDHRPPGRLLRAEFVPVLPLEASLLLLAALCAVLVRSLGVLGLLPLAGIVYVPRLAMAALTRGGSVARLDPVQAMGVYLDALADELALRPSLRRVAHGAHAFLARRPVADPRPPFPGRPVPDQLFLRGRPIPGPPLFPRGLPVRDPELLSAITCALEVDICERRAPVQPAYRPAPDVQALLVARAWAHLTARGTRALNHEEALCEMRATHLRTDAPDALAAAAAIAARERALTHHTSTLPRLHRLWIPRGLRTGSLPGLLGRLAA